MKLKTIDVNILEWFDKLNGNSYFAGTITINYGLKSEAKIKMPYQYGYGDHYLDMATQYLVDNGYFSLPKLKTGGYPALWKICREWNIILRYTKKESCLKRELKNI